MASLQKIFKAELQIKYIYGSGLPSKMIWISVHSILKFTQISMQQSGMGGDLIFLCCSLTITYRSPPHPVTGHWKEEQHTDELICHSALTFISMLLTLQHKLFFFLLSDKEFKSLSGVADIWGRKWGGNFLKKKHFFVKEKWSLLMLVSFLGRFLLISSCANISIIPKIVLI